LARHWGKGKYNYAFFFFSLQNEMSPNIMLYACVGPWIVAGDFNQIYKLKDKNNSVGTSRLGYPLLLGQDGPPGGWDYP
jgi:hypothetical protein